MTKLVGVGIVLAGAAAGFLGSAALHVVVVGALSLATGSATVADLLALGSRSIDFGMVFGLLSGAHWALAAAARHVSDEAQSARLVKALCILMVVVAIGLALTGGRWDSMFRGLSGPGLVLIVAWLAMTHFVSKALERRTSSERTA